MNIYLKALSLDLAIRKKDAILIMDGAGWHKSKELIVPENIKIEILPPYCPELNPVERLWRYVKNSVKKIRDIFEDFNECLEKVLCYR
jgi:transposase